MSKMVKRILGIILSVIGIMLFISLYVMVILNQADYIKYIVTIVGYLCVVIFTVGIIMFKGTLTPKEKK